MPVKQSRERFVFDKLGRQLTKLAAKPGVESVHRFRTAARRVETVLGELVPSPDRKGKKLLKLLTRLRKKAGRLRDLDVEIGALRNLRLPEGTLHKAKLLRTLADQRSRCEEKFVREFDRRTVRELRKRLKRAATEISVPEGKPMAMAQRVMAKVTQHHGPLTERTLHQYRIAGKRARYLAELAGQDAEAARLVERLKRMQDVVGDWHDWLKLTQRAEKLFEGVENSSLIAALRNLTRAKFRQAIIAVAELRAESSAKKPALIESRQPQATAKPRQSAVA